MQDRTTSFSDHELVAAFIDKRLTDNLEAFKNYLPNIHDKFSDYKEENIYLIYDDAGNINLFDRSSETLLYGNNPVQQCLDNLNGYFNSPVQRPFFILPGGDDKQPVNGDVNYVHSSHLKKLGEFQFSALASIGEKILDIIKSRSDKNYTPIESEVDIEHKLPDFINAMFLFSVGMGFDFEKLYLERDIKHLYIIEPDPDVFYASMQLIDWGSILKKAIEKDFKLHIIVERDYASLLNEVSLLVTASGRHNVAGAYLYSAFYKESYSDIFKDLKQAISYSYLSGFGFYDDSRYSLAHTVGNFQANIPILASNRSLKKDLGQDDMPVMIIGNGPSLDHDLDFIFRNQDNFVVVSCGSSLRTLLKNEIQPDFHVELERTASVTCWIKKSSDGIDNFFDILKEITLIQVSQVHPGVAELFNKKGMLLKDIETGSSFLNYSIPNKGLAILPRLAPSCVHSAVTSLVVMGFKDFYLFGTDMGTVDVTKHHSKDSSYKYLKKDVAEGFNFKKGAEVYKSNFGDKEVYSSGYFPMFKRELESIIAGWNYTMQDSLNFYNCSDGSFIEGTSSLHSEDIDIGSLKNNFHKQELLNAVFDAFFSFSPDGYEESLLENLECIKLKVDDACDYAISMIEPISDIPQAFTLTDRFIQEFHSDLVLDDNHAWLYSIFDGSLLYMLSVITSTAMLPISEQVALKSINSQFEQLALFFKDVKSDFRDHCLDWDQENRYDMFDDKV